MVYSILPIVFTLSMPDFSRVGCEIDVTTMIPNIEVSIVDFGAVAGDDEDDAKAIISAIESISNSGGTVFIPSGKWILRDVVQLRDDKIRLSGARDGSTILYCPQPLAELFGEDKKWSWSGGFVSMSPRGKPKQIGKATSFSSSGSSRIEVSWSEEPSVGDWLQIWWHNDVGKDTLLAWLYGNAIPKSKYGKEMQESTSARVRSWFKVVGSDANTLTLDPPLPMPLKPAWNPTIMSVPKLQHCIVENLTFDFVTSTYPGHLKERGHNAIAASGLVECELRNISTENADCGIILGNCGFVTLVDIHFRGRYMHHPISLSWCSHCLVEDFIIDAPHQHGTTISWSSHLNVFNRGRGNELAMDSHRACSFRNLHQDIVIVHGDNPQQPLRSGGSRPRGLHAARENVYWNIEHKFQSAGPPFTIKYLDQWPLGIFVGWHGNRKIDIQPILDGQIVTGVDIKQQTLPFELE